MPPASTGPRPPGKATLPKHPGGPPAWFRWWSEATRPPPTPTRRPPADGRHPSRNPQPWNHPGRGPPVERGMKSSLQAASRPQPPIAWELHARSTRRHLPRLKPGLHAGAEATRRVARMVPVVERSDTTGHRPPTRPRTPEGCQNPRHHDIGHFARHALRDAVKAHWGCGRGRPRSRQRSRRSRRGVWARGGLNLGITQAAVRRWSEAWSPAFRRGRVRNHPSRGNFMRVRQCDASPG
jgi:hypothetical protein